MTKWYLDGGSRDSHRKELGTLRRFRWVFLGHSLENILILDFKIGVVELELDDWILKCFNLFQGSPGGIFIFINILLNLFTGANID